MNCSKLEEDIALYAGGDLPDGRVARVEQHLAECADCRVLAEELRAGQALLAELRDEPLEDAMVARVRRNVLAQIGTARPARLFWKFALAAALVLAMVLAWPRHPAVKPAPVAVARVEAPQVTPAPAVKPVKSTPTRHRAARRLRAPAAEPQGPPLLVQFTTSDPNIVIYWLVDQKPQGD
jgi:hypothetical protein